LFVTAFLVLRGLSPVNLFGLHPVQWKPVVVPAVVGIAAIFPIVIIATYVSQLLLGEERGGDATIAFLRNGPGPTALILAGVLVVLVAPFVEEFLFRGLLYGVAKRFGGRVPAIIATSILFAAVHITPGSLLPLLMLSVGLTVAYERTGSLWTPVLMHMAFNGTQFAIILLFPQWIQ
jgi:membrane protease YdiL (CAAX protease family)